MPESLRRFLERVLASGLLTPELVDLASTGATDVELASAPPLPDDLRDLLAWRNGLDLDVVRLHGVSDVGRPIRRTAAGSIAFASDPAGFAYLLRRDGTIVRVDHDAADEQVVAHGVDDFLRGYVFGPRAAAFGGADWAREVAAAIEGI